MNADDETVEDANYVSNTLEPGTNNIGFSDEEQPDEMDATAFKLKARQLDETEYDESDRAEQLYESDGKQRSLHKNIII